MTQLQELSEGDEVVLTIGGTEYEGFVSYWHHREWERIGGIPKKGRLSVDVELTTECVETTDVETHSLKIYATEKRPGEFEVENPKFWNPVVEDEMIVEDKYDQHGELESIKIKETAV